MVEPDIIVPAPARRLRVFVCHDSSDGDRVRDLSRRLTADGFQPWLAENELVPGQDWDREIRKAIRDADVILVCVSRHSASKRGYVQKEIRLALDMADERPPDSIFLIPVRLEPTDVPDPLYRWHRIDLFHDAGYGRLLEALRHRALQIGDVVGAIHEFEFAGLVDTNGLPLSRSAHRGSTLVIEIKNVNATIFEDLKANPKRWYELSPAKFEEVVADLLSAQGYEVTRTPLSKDGGFDMYAAKKDGLGEFLYLVECKKYTPPHKVGVEMVRSLRGVLSDRRATAAALVTTSFFTTGARALQARNAHQLKLHDYAVLQEWLKQRRRDTT